MKAPIYESVASIHINSIAMGMHASSKNVYVLTILPVSVHCGLFNSSQAPVCLFIRTLAYLLCSVALHSLLSSPISFPVFGLWISAFSAKSKCNTVWIRTCRYKYVYMCKYLRAIGSLFTWANTQRPLCTFNIYIYPYTYISHFCLNAESFATDSLLASFSCSFTLLHFDRIQCAPLLAVRMILTHANSIKHLAKTENSAQWMKYPEFCRLLVYNHSISSQVWTSSTCIHT